MNRLFFIALLLFHFSANGQCNLYGKLIGSTDKSPVPFAKIILFDNPERFTISDEFGRFHFENLQCQNYNLSITSLGFEKLEHSVSIENKETEIEFMLTDTMQLKAVHVYSNSNFESRGMRTVEEMILTHGKKTQLIELDKLIANTSNNNARELFASVPGLNIWESDGGGLQLGIGARGLSPNRTAHFNTRQNGYDISADALGYPETYYTPPSEAIKEIQLIRGAASLQFGPQFGGMLNFQLIEPSAKKFSYTGQQSYGGYNLFNTFNSISGTIKKKFSYLGYYKYKQGDGWRDNSNFKQHNAFGQLKYHFNEKISILGEYTYMSYLAKQAGGLTDAMFNENPRQSIRSRNWFKVNWNLFAVNLNWEINMSTKLDLKVYKVIASREALGNLDKITRLDDFQERDLISGNFNNLGAELRFLKHYPIGNKMKGSLVAGLRYYTGKTKSFQGLADAGSDANFQFLNPENLEASSYTFPSNNYSAFLENMFRVSKKIWLSAGVRYEFIQTQAIGSYRELIYHPLTEDLLFDSTYFEEKNSKRNILLGGLGITYRFDDNAEIYGNVSQNYRGINFSDIRINNPNQLVDDNIQDEKGFNADFGFRGKKKNLQFDLSCFFLYYNNKIGIINKKINEFESVRYRTNIGQAYSTGVEIFAEYLIKNRDSSQLYSSVFMNGSYVYAKYGNTLESAYNGNDIELVPPFTLKVGYKLFVHKLSFSYLFSFVQKHYSDGTNAEFDPNAVAGIIPSYYVMDFGVNYDLNKHLRLKGGINNFTNNSYFTRRASAYPGPGIIPSNGINFYLTLKLTL